MKIAIVAPSDKSFIANLLPDINIDNLPDGYSGAPFIGILIRELLSQNHEVIAITTTVAVNNDFTVKEFSKGKFKWIVVPARKHSIRFNGKKPGRIMDFFAFERTLLESVIKKNQPDIIHAHWSYEFAAAAINTKIPCLVTIHDNAYQVLKYYKNIYRLGRLLMSEWVLRKVKYASTVSPYMLPYVQARCKKVSVIPNPVFIPSSPNEIVSIIEKRVQTISAPKLVMVTNGWSKLKNGKVGLLAFKLLKEVLPAVTLHLFGVDTEENGLAYKDCKSISIGNVFFHGPVSHNTLLSAISTAHILIHPSLEESFGVVLIEAMARGIPAIGGVSSGAVPWVINDPDLLVDVSKPSLIKTKIIKLLSDHEFYRQISFKCFNNALSRFSAARIAGSYLSYYSEILDNWENIK